MTYCNEDILIRIASIKCILDLSNNFGPWVDWSGSWFTITALHGCRILQVCLSIYFCRSTQFHKILFQFPDMHFSRPTESRLLAVFTYSFAEEFIEYLIQAIFCCFSHSFLTTVFVSNLQRKQHASPSANKQLLGLPPCQAPCHSMLQQSIWLSCHLDFSLWTLCLFYFYLNYLYLLGIDNLKDLYVVRNWLLLLLETIKIY